MVTSPESYATLAKVIDARYQEFSQIVVVVSAMKGKTNELIALAQAVHPNPPKREYDMLVSVGERMSISLLAMALELQGRPAVSFTGSQSGIMTCGSHSEARIRCVRPYRIRAALEGGKCAIVAGFQGMSLDREITTLGRGGSDTTAVALGIALGAERVEFYKDVPGIYSQDPKQGAGERYERLCLPDALEIARKGGVLHPRALELADKYGMPLCVRGLDGSPGTLINSNEIFTPTEEVCEALASLVN